MFFAGNVAMNISRITLCKWTADGTAQVLVDGTWWTLAAADATALRQTLQRRVVHGLSLDSSLAVDLYLNGVALSEGVDYTVGAGVVTFVPAAQPKAGDLLRVRYR